MMQRHDQAEHFAALAEYALAQELIDRAGSGPFVRAVMKARNEGQEYFYDVICALIETAEERVRFYDWGPASGGSEHRASDGSSGGGEDATLSEVRWVCSFDTEPSDIDAFVADIARVTSAV